MNELYSINKSRLGYAYQYKYALLCILKFLLGGRLRKAWIDFPFSYRDFVNLSLDINLELMNPDATHIYEVKTGDDFKTDRIEQLKKVLKNLYFYEKNNGLHCDKFIIISPEVESKILEHWNDFLFVKSRNKRNLHREKQSDVQNRVFSQFALNAIGIGKIDFVRFIRQITFHIGPSYQHNSNLDQLSDLEDQIKSEIDNFCSNLNLRTSEIEIPSWSIASELLEVLNKCSENNTEAVKELLGKLSECLSRRRLIKEAKYKKDKEKIFDGAKKEIEDRLVNITKVNYKDESVLLRTQNHE